MSRRRGQPPPHPLCVQWDGEPEAPAEFLARLQGSIDYSNTDLKGSRHQGGAQQASAGEPRTGAGGGAALRGDEEARAAARAAAAAHTSDPAALAGAVRYGLDPVQAAAYARGWEQAKELDRMWDTREFQAVRSRRWWWWCVARGDQGRPRLRAHVCSCGCGRFFLFF